MSVAMDRPVWTELSLAPARAARHPAETFAALDRMFRLGTLPDPAPAGEHVGLMLLTRTVRPLDAAARVAARATSPWAGKTFDPAAARGENRLTAAGRAAAALLWPGYRLRPIGHGLYAGFPFRTSRGAGLLDPDREVLKLDYDLPENPRRVVRGVVDELVEVAAGAYLGKWFVRAGGRARQAGYFALGAPGLG